MDFSKVKLIVSDMDGTLLNEHGEFGPDFFTIYQELKSLDIKFAAASGRQYYNLLEKFENLKDELIFIAENGAVVMKGDQEIHLQPMPREKAIEIIQIVRKLGGKHLILCGKKQAYIEDQDPDFMEPFLKHYSKYKVVDDLTQIKDDPFLKLTICDLSGAEEHTFPHVKRFQKDLHVKLSGEIWIDFTDKTADKGHALQIVQKLYDIKPDETMVFGDYLNDMELFNHAKFSYAMENAHPEIKTKATYLTDSNSRQGVEKVLHQLLDDRKEMEQQN